MPRPRVDTVRIHLSIDRHTHERLSFYLFDPGSAKVKYGTMREIINRLLAQFVKQLEQSEDPVRLLRAYGVKLEIPTTTTGANSNANN